MSKWGWELCCVLKGEMCAYTYVNKQANIVGVRLSVSLHPGANSSAWQPLKPKVELEIDFISANGIKPKKEMFFWWPTNLKSLPLKFVPSLVRLFSCDIKRTSSLLPKGICPFYLVRRVLQRFAFLNCLAAQACSVCAVWNVSLSHVTAVLKLMLDFLQQIWIMLKSVLSWRGYVNNSQMGLSVLSSRETSSLWQEQVLGRSIIPSLKATLLLITALAWQWPLRWALLLSNEH